MAGRAAGPGLSTPCCQCGTFSQADEGGGKGRKWIETGKRPWFPLDTAGESLAPWGVGRTIRRNSGEKSQEHEEGDKQK